jgi:hypothetical protein
MKIKNCRKGKEKEKIGVIEYRQRMQYGGRDKGEGRKKEN